jgi:archaellum component FlaC
MADPAQAQAALLQAQALLKDPTVQSDPVKLKKAQDSVDYLTGVINADHSEDARTAGLKQQGELTLEHARAADQMRLESMKEADALKGLTGLAAVDPNAPLSDLQKDSIGQMATSFIQTGALPNIGRTKESAAILQKVVERAAAIRNKLGMTPEEAAQLPANFKANQGSLNNLQKQYGNINSYEQNVEKGIPLLESAYANVSRSNIPLLDKFIFPAESAAGVGGTQALKNAVETTSSEYAKVMAGFGSQTSDSARAHAREVLNEYQSKGQLQQGLTILKKEMANRIGSMSDEIGNTNHRLTLQGLLDSARGKTLVAGVPSQSAGPSSSIDDIKKKHGISY